ncbi:unnamed protein product [Didymodactylos carnosus]|uniref:Uncharacterized protein n=1 Tax=Didymodactylos carnosus TaxID=1234261 RepID=A0A8S2DS17_9BILA|nr:unnamed protein product [Didymodactylos carnosus]CAF3787149.1 unnamed protein product [Didymodactylos carnosus]
MTFTGFILSDKMASYTRMPKDIEQEDEEINTPKTTTGRDHIVNMNVTALTPTNRVVLFEDFIEAEQSSVEETMGIVSNKDDYTMPCLTVRSWIIGILFTLLMTTINQYYYYSTWYYTFPSTLVLILAYPMGKFLEWCLPRKQFKIPFFNSYHQLNPGKFTIKEHTVIMIMALVAEHDMSSIDVLVVHRNSDATMNFALGLFLVISSQFIGYGMAGEKKTAACTISRL